MLVDEYTLQQTIGNGAFGEVYLTSKEGTNRLFAAKKVSKAKINSQEISKYFINEIMILKEVSHVNIIRFEAVKHTIHNYYIITEYCNGGSLSECLKRYKSSNGHSFTEEIVQHFMRQIVDALKYLHGKKIIHRDIKLDNILLNFNNENDKNNQNLLKATVKIIDFGFAAYMEKSRKRFSTLGSPINMDPILLKKLTSKSNITNSIGYDEKADIWSLGTICYEMLIGEGVFQAKDMKDLVEQVENGTYHVPINLSKESISFLNCMLQYDSKNRLSAEELSRHYFLTKNVSEFKKLDLSKLGNKIDNKGLNINIKKDESIGAILSEQEQKNLMNLQEGSMNTNNNQNKINSIGNNYNNIKYPLEYQNNKGTMNNINDLKNLNNNNLINKNIENRNLNLARYDYYQKAKTMNNNVIPINRGNIQANPINQFNLLNKQKNYPHQHSLPNNQNIIYINNNNNKNNLIIKNGQIIQNNNILNNINYNKNNIQPNYYNQNINQLKTMNNINSFSPKKNMIQNPPNMIPNNYLLRNNKFSQYMTQRTENSRSPLPIQRNNNILYNKSPIPQKEFQNNNLLYSPKVLNNNQQRLKSPLETNQMKKLMVPINKDIVSNRFNIAKTPNRIVNIRRHEEKRPTIYQNKNIQNEKEQMQNINQIRINQNQGNLVQNANPNNMNIIYINKNQNNQNNLYKEGQKDNTKNYIINRNKGYGNNPKLNIKININPIDDNAEMLNITNNKIYMKTSPNQ